MSDNQTLDTEAHAIRASVRRGLFGEPSVQRVGRFRVVRPLGRGGMGVVYEAHDPQLERTVAVKLLRSRGPEGQPAGRPKRLLREAKAMARLSHPNVVTVFEVGSVDDAVYVAMEHIDGQTLRQWMHAKPRSWQEIVDVFVQAGRGLAHAHAAGVVHRDFKPDNVMIDADGRVRVLDFGLAHWGGVHLPTIGDDPAITGQGPRLTVTGAVMGTPAYMAPEQRSGPGALAASDQYAFCVSLYEALAGQRPTPQSPGAARGDRPMPPALRRIVQRGLAPEPAERWPSMVALLARLKGQRTHRRWRWGTLAVGAGALVAASGLSPLSPAAQHESAEADCPLVAADAGAVWSSSRHLALAERFSADARGFVQEAWPGVETAIDQRMSTWTEVAEPVCEPGRPAEVRLWQSLCLRVQLRRLDGLLRVFESGDPAMLEHATTSLLALEDASACDPDRVGTSHAALPQDPAALEAVLRLEVELQAARAEGRAQRFDAGIVRAQSAIDQAEVLEVAPWVARGLRVRAQLEVGAGRPALAEQTLRSAIEHGQAGHDDAEVAQAWVSLVHVVGEDLARVDEAQRMFGLAQGAVTRAGEPAALRGRWLQTQASIYDQAGQPDRALELLSQALTVVEGVDGPQHPRVARVLHGLARALRTGGAVQASLPHIQRALAIAEASFGPRHPEVATHLTALGSAQAMLGRDPVAVEAFSRARAILVDALGPEHVRVGAAEYNLGATHMQAQRIDQARVHLLRATEIDAKTLDEHNPMRVPAIYGLAMAHFAADEYDQAQRMLSQGLEIVERAWGSEHPDLAYLITGLADLAAARGDHLGALEGYDRVTRVLEGALGSEHRRLVPGFRSAAQSHLALGQPREALPLLERALPICDRGDLDPMEVAGVHMALARTLVALDVERPRAVALARRAGVLWRGAGEGFAERAREADQWLAEFAPQP